LAVTSEAHSTVSTGALKKGSRFTETVLTYPVSEPSSSLSSVCRSMSVKLSNIVGFQLQ
jgi:hypothetical protein